MQLRDGAGRAPRECGEDFPTLVFAAIWRSDCRGCREDVLTRNKELRYLTTQRENFVTRRLAEVSVVTCLALLESPRQCASDLGRHEPGPDEVLLKERDGPAVPRRVQVPRGQQRASGIERRVVHAIQRAAEVALTNEDVAFRECLMCADHPMASELAGRIHNAMLSPATFLMKGVCRQTGSLRMLGVITRGEM